MRRKIKKCWSGQDRATQEFSEPEATYSTRSQAEGSKQRQIINSIIGEPSHAELTEADCGNIRPQPPRGLVKFSTLLESVDRGLYPSPIAISSSLFSFHSSLGASYPLCLGFGFTSISLSLGSTESVVSIALCAWHAQLPQYPVLSWFSFTKSFKGTWGLKVLMSMCHQW